jgi:hypothetical protein
LWHGTQRLALEPKVLQMLLYLLEHRDRLVSAAGLFWLAAGAGRRRPRAVHAGLALVTTIHTLGNDLLQDCGRRLAIRIGIHTGLVVVGGGQEGALSGPLAAGAPPRLAATIAGLAAPDTVVISASTSALVQGFFVCESLGEQALPGTTVLCALYHVRGASGARGRLDVVPAPQLTPFMGREGGLAVLRERLAQVRQGYGQAVLVRGDAGMGKSRLVQQVNTALLAEGFTVLAYWGSPYTHHTALHPVVEWLQGCLHGDGDLSGPALLARLEALVRQAGLDLPEHLPLLATLVRLDLPEARYPALQLTPLRTWRRHTGACSSYATRWARQRRCFSPCMACACFISCAGSARPPDRWGSRLLGWPNRGKRLTS